MKKHSFKIVLKTTLSAAVLAILLSANTNAAELPAGALFPEPAATVKFISADSNGYVFNVIYDNEAGEKFLLQIKDEEGNTLFTGTFTDKKFEKRFRLMRDAVTGKLNFVIKNLKDNSSQTFQVETSSRVVEDVVVKKLNQ